MANRNCLEGMACPECGSGQPFRITVSTTVEMWDNGTESHGDVEYYDDAYCQCVMCSHSGKVVNFRLTEETATAEAI
ncbi:MAG: hypothetical protein ACYDHY_09405 [Acidiferrobacterales bacterium]